MKKYRLRKDTPTLKAGTILVPHRDYLTYLQVEGRDSSSMESFPIETRDEWLEDFCEKWVPKCGEIYYVPEPTFSDLQIARAWFGDIIDNMFFRRNLVCKTSEEAIEKANKMLDVLEEESE